MRKSALAAMTVAAATLLGASSGQAATIISGLRASASSQVFYDKTKEKNVSKVVSFGDTQGTPGTSTRDPWGGSSFNSFVQTGNNSVYFESSNSVSKKYTKANNTVYVKTNSSTTLSFEFLNDSKEDVPFQSLITAAGIGYYLANTANCAYSGCPEVSGVSLLKDVVPFTAGSIATDAAKTSFAFRITDAFRGTDGGVGNALPTAAGMMTRYSVSGSSALSFRRDANGKISSYFNDNLSDARKKLNGFTLSSGIPVPGKKGLPDPAAHAFAWDDTPVSFTLSPGRHFLSYTTFVSSEVYSRQLACGANLLAFAGFGDPIGRAGAVEGADEAADGVAAFSLKPPGCPANGPIKGLTFKPQVYRAPVVKDGKLVYTPTGNVPEPATWATMILGFGAIGTVLRRRRAVTAA